MPTTFGFSTALGWIPPTFDELVVYLQGLYETETGVLVDLEVKSATLDLIRTEARILKALYDDNGGTYTSGFILTATGAALQNLLTPLIGPPLAALPSTVVLPLTGTGGFTVTAGSTVTLNSDGVGALPWVLDGDVLLPGNGTFTYSDPGPKSAEIGSTWTVDGLSPDWTGAGPNPASGSRGREPETTLEYRKRFAASSVGTRLLASVLAVAGVSTAAIFENPTDIPDSFWGATHWVELLVQGGTDADIAAAIQSSRAFTVQTLGGVTVVTPAPGFPGGVVSIRFSRPTLIDIWVRTQVTKGEGYSSDTSAAAVTARETAISDQVVAWGGTRPVGLDLSAFQVSAQVIQTPTVPGISDVATLIDIVFPPALTSIIAAPRDLLVFDAARVTVTGA